MSGLERMTCGELTFHRYLGVRRSCHPFTGPVQTLSRVKAYGAKWYKWYVGQRLWQQSKSKVIPEEHRKYTLIEFGPQGDYYISSKLRKLFRETRDA